MHHLVDHNLINDYKEISIWNAKNLQHYKFIRKPFYKYLSGTMVDLHIYCQENKYLLFIMSIFRSISFFFGVSNPMLGFIIWISLIMSSELLLLYTVIVLSISTIICKIFNFEDELINNGLYPSNCILIILYLHIFQNSMFYDPLQGIKMGIILVVLSTISIFLFHCFADIFIKKLKVVPMLLVPTMVIILWCTFCQYSSYFPNVSISPQPIKPHEIPFNITFKEYMESIVKGVSDLGFMPNLYGAIPVSIAIFIASPINMINSWIGSFLGISISILLGLDKNIILNELIGLNTAITYSVLCGNFFVINQYTALLGTIGVVLTVLFYGFLKYIFPPIIPILALPSIISSILIYCINNVNNLIKVHPYDLTVPEDHLRRYKLTKYILKDLKMTKNFIQNKNLSLDELQSIEKIVTPIIICYFTKIKNLNELMKLIDLNVDTNSQDYDGRAGLHIAGSIGSIDIIKLFLMSNADINITDNYNSTPLYEALINKHYKCAEYIYKNGGKVSISSEILCSKLCYIVYNNDSKILEYWLKCGISPNHKDYDNRTPLHIAYTYTKECIDILLKYGADETIVDRWGKLPNGKEATTLEILDENKPYHKIQENYNVSSITSNQILEIILDSILDSNDEDYKNALLPSILCEIVRNNNNSLLDEYLFKDDEYINRGDYDNRTPLHICSSVGNYDMCRKLICYITDINIKDRFNHTFLFESIINGHSNISKLLYDHGARIEKTDEIMSLVCWYAYHNNIYMIKTFNDYGIDIKTISDYDNRTPLDIANDMGHKNLVKYLE